jgi:hypothetical protein
VLKAELQAKPELAEQTINEKEAVHPQTLSAFVKKQVEADAEVSAAITVLPLRFAKITLPKKRARDAI